MKLNRRWCIFGSQSAMRTRMNYSLKYLYMYMLRCPVFRVPVWITCMMQIIMINCCYLQILILLSSLLPQIQQARKGESKYSGSLDCARQLLKEGRIRSLYRGTMATLLRGTPVINHILGQFTSFIWSLNFQDNARLKFFLNLNDH